MSNPLTVMTILEFAKKENAKAFINTAAASGLGKMLLL